MLEKKNSSALLCIHENLPAFWSKILNFNKISDFEWSCGLLGFLFAPLSLISITDLYELL